VPLSLVGSYPWRENPKQCSEEYIAQGTACTQDYGIRISHSYNKQIRECDRITEHCKRVVDERSKQMEQEHDLKWHHYDYQLTLGR
jgi:hypothetical protein